MTENKREDIVTWHHCSSGLDGSCAESYRQVCLCHFKRTLRFVAIYLLSICIEYVTNIDAVEC